MTDDLIDVPLTDEERLFLRCGLSEWGGPARCTDALAFAMGFRNVANLHEEGHLLQESLGRHEPLSQHDWVRTLLATEIVFASNVVGSGRDWSISAGFSDEDSIRLLRTLQRKIPIGGRSNWRETFKG